MSGRRAIKRSEGTAWPNGAPHTRKRRPRKPVPRPAGWHLGGVGLAQADQVGGDDDDALRAVPGAWVPFERAGDGSGPARPYLRKLSSKALLYRCANSRAGMLRAGGCRRRPRTPWSSKCAGQVYVVGAGGVEPPSSSVSANYRNRCAAARFPRSRSTVGAEVKCSHSVQLTALLTRSSFTDTAPIIATSCSTPCLLHRALPAQTHSNILPRHPTYTLISTPAPTQPRTSHLSVVPLPSSRTIQIQHTRAVHRWCLCWAGMRGASHGGCSW